MVDFYLQPERREESINLASNKNNLLIFPLISLLDVSFGALTDKKERKHISDGLRGNNYMFIT